MPKKQKAPSKELQYIGDRIRDARNDSNLTQQELADATGRGIRHLQGIERGLVNPSYEVLSSIICRLAMSADALFYPDLTKQEEDESHLLCKFAACTEEERRFILSTVDFMVEQFIRRRNKQTSSSEGE